WQTTEPGTAPPRQRLRALARLVDAGVDAGGGVGADLPGLFPRPGLPAGAGWARTLPGLSDRPDLLADVVKAARDAGATSVWTSLLNLRPGTREHFLEALGREWRELAPRYERLSRGRAYLGRAEVDPVRRRV